MTVFAGIEAFVQTAEQLSFRRAAARLAVSPAAVSKAVARLEERLDVKLLDRTSRKVALTPEGATYLAHCQRALQALQAGSDSVSHAQRVPEGTLRVSLPTILGRKLVSELPRLTECHPRLRLDLRVSDRKVKLLEEDVDVVVRFGVLEDSALISRRLRTPRWVTVASPAYLARHGTPRTPAELVDHLCLKFTTPGGGVSEWVFCSAPGGPGVERKLPSGHQIDQGEHLVVAAVAGVGVVQAFDFLVADAVNAGTLVEILPQFATEALQVHALCRPGRQLAPKVRVFLDYLSTILGAHRVEPSR